MACPSSSLCPLLACCSPCSGSPTDTCCQAACRQVTSLAWQCGRHGRLLDRQNAASGDECCHKGYTQNVTIAQLTYRISWHAVLCKQESKPHTLPFGVHVSIVSSKSWERHLVHLVLVQNDDVDAGASAGPLNVLRTQVGHRLHAIQHHLWIGKPPCILACSSRLGLQMCTACCAVRRPWPALLPFFSAAQSGPGHASRCVQQCIVTKRTVNASENPWRVCNAAAANCQQWFPEEGTCMHGGAVGGSPALAGSQPAHT